MAGPAGARVLGRLADNLAHYWNLLVTAAQKELAWLHAALPNEAAWAATLVTAVLGSLEPPLRSCVAKAVEETRRPDEELVRDVVCLRANTAACSWWSRSLPFEGIRWLARGDACLPSRAGSRRAT